jgi:hypothetical protein
MNKLKSIYLLLCLLVFTMISTAAVAPMTSPIATANAPVVKGMSNEELQTLIAQASGKMSASETAAMEKKSFFGKIVSKVSNKATQLKAKYKLIRAIKTDSRLLKLGLIILGIGLLLWIVAYVIAVSSTATTGSIGILALLYILGYLAILVGLVVTIVGLVK